MTTKTTTTEKFDGEGKLVERVIVTEYEAEYVPPVITWTTPAIGPLIYPNPVLQPQITWTSGNVCKA